MSKTKHTPGPWIVQDGQEVIVKNASETRLIARCYAGHSIEREANARLIAASPRLLVALRRAVEAESNDYSWLDDAQAAISEAEDQK
jgi:hypothetical protein